MNANALIGVVLALLLSSIGTCIADEQQNITDVLKEMGAANISVETYNNFTETITIAPYPMNDYVVRADIGIVNATFYLRGNMTAEQMKTLFKAETSKALEEGKKLEAKGFTNIKVKLEEQTWIMYDFYDVPIQRVSLIGAEKFGVKWDNYWVEEDCCETRINIVPLRAKTAALAINVTDFAEEAALLKGITGTYGGKLMISQSDDMLGMVTYQEVTNITAADKLVRENAEDYDGYQVAVWIEIPYDSSKDGKTPSQIEEIENRTKLRFIR